MIIWAIYFHGKTRLKCIYVTFMENNTASYTYQGLNCFGFSFPGRKQTHSGSFPRTLTLPSVTEIAWKMPRDGTTHCQVLVQNSYIRAVPNTRPIPSDFSKTKQQEPFPAGQGWRPQHHQAVVCCSSFPRGVFPTLPIPGLLAQALHQGTRPYLDAMVVSVNDCCHSDQDGVSSVHSL